MLSYLENVFTDVIKGLERKIILDYPGEAQYHYKCPCKREAEGKLMHRWQ